MINVKATILQTIIKQFDKLRKLAINDTNAFKKILCLIIMDDMYDWGVYLGLDDCSLLQIAEIRKDYILCNSVFRLQDASKIHPYINVNTPQNNDTWKRVWDAPEVTIITSVQEVSEDAPKCTRPQQVHFITLNAEGVPDVDINTLSDCEKMDIYIDKESGKMFYWNSETKVWELISPNALTEEDVEKICDKKSPGVTSAMSGSTILTQITSNKSDTSNINTVTDKDVEDWL